MRKLVCDGVDCGIAEDSSVSRSKRVIQRVKLSIVIDDRESWAGSTIDYEADLCTDCQLRVLHNYFGIPAQGKTVLPAFIEPQSIRAIR